MIEVALSPSSYKRFVKLGWEILKHKYHYYRLNENLISDAEYDQLDREYMALSKELGLEPTAGDMVDYKDDRPSCELVAMRESRNTKKKRKAFLEGLYPNGCPCSKCSPPQEKVEEASDLP